MSVFTSMQISSSALSAQNIRLNSISSNLANIHSSQTPQGGPYKEKSVVFMTKNSDFEQFFQSNFNNQLQGVRVDRIVESNAPPKKIYDPDHPNAGKDGFVKMPNINLLEEVTDMTAAVKAYEANVTSIKSAQRMAMKALQIGS